MQAFVINLPETVDARLSKARRISIERELERAQLEYRFVSSVDGFRLDDVHQTKVDPEAVARHAHWLTPGVVGASLSHLRAYEEIIAAGVPAALVLEDDAALPPDLSLLLEDLATRLTGAEVVLLYWRTWGGCEFSAVQAEDVATGGHLMYPVDPHRLNCASGYVVTREACERMLKALTPVQTGTDAWGEFYDRGGFDRLRCVVPGVVGMRTEFKSTVDYLDPDSMSAKLSAFVAHHRVFPVYHVLGWRRARRVRRTTAYTIVDRPSPLAGTPRAGR